MTAQFVMTYVPIIGGMTLLFTSGFVAGRLTSQWRRAYCFASAGWADALNELTAWKQDYSKLAWDYRNLSALYLTTKYELEHRP